MVKATQRGKIRRDCMNDSVLQTGPRSAVRHQKGGCSYRTRRGWKSSGAGRGAGPRIRFPPRKDLAKKCQLQGDLIKVLCSKVTDKRDAEIAAAGLVSDVFPRSSYRMGTTAYHWKRSWWKSPSFLKKTWCTTRQMSEAPPTAIVAMQCAEDLGRSSRVSDMRCSFRWLL